MGGSGKLAGVTGVQLSDISGEQGANRARAGGGDGGLRWGGAIEMRGHKFSSHTHNDCVTGD